MLSMRNGIAKKEEDRVEFLNLILGRYDYNRLHFAALIEDTANTNRAFLQKVKPFIVVCSLQKFNSAVEYLFLDLDDIWKD